MASDYVMFKQKARMQLSGQWGNAALGTLIYLALMAVSGATYVLELVVYGPLTIGYFLFLGCLIDKRELKLDLLFSGFYRFVETLIAGLLISLIVSVAAIFLVVPGIIALCGLSMTLFIMNDNPEISGIEALKMSWNMMNGHKWDLFVLWFSFIGWIFLSLLTCGLGFLWLYSYMTVATLNFYRQLRYGTF